MQFLYRALSSNELKALHILLPPAHLYTPFLFWVFELQAILRKVHWMAQNDLEPTMQRYPIYVLLASTSPKFHSVSLYDQPYSSYRPFWEMCT